MSDSEFDIIRRYFMRQLPDRKDVITGIGDDAALLRVPAGVELVVCVDTLVEGVHFPAGTSAAAVGHTALAVNLSDLAAMGAEPAWVTLAMTLPAPDADWLDGFCRGFFKLADRFGVQLVGGDTTQGPLSITVQAHGFVPQGKALQRRGAQPGDHIYVTGSLGDAGVALLLGSDAAEALQQRLDFPEPRLAAGQALRGIASAAIDISDGLLADLGHLLAHGQLGASVSVDDVPTSAAFNAALQQGHDLTRLRDLSLAAGDDYELCFTVPEALLGQLDTVRPDFSCSCTRIGTVERPAGIRCYTADGDVYAADARGYEHFGVSPHG